MRRRALPSGRNGEVTMVWVVLVVIACEPAVDCLGPEWSYSRSLGRLTRNSWATKLAGLRHDFGYR